MKLINEEKQNFRKFARHIRSGIDTNICSNYIVRNIKSWQIYNNAQNIMLFYPINTELSLLELLKDSSKNFYFPKVINDEMKPVLYNPIKGFTKGKFSINEPVGEYLDDYSILDLVFYPALAADRRGYRLGYGKGFYDRFSSKLNSKTIKALPISSKLIFNEIPREVHDCLLDFLITEKEIKSICH